MRRKHILVIGIILAGFLVVCIGAANKDDPKSETPEQQDEHIYGNSFRGMAMSVEPAQEQYRIDEPIEAKVLIKNSGESEIVLKGIRGTFQLYRFGLFFPDGRAVPTSDYMRKIEDRWNKPPMGPTSYLHTEVKPGETTVGWFDIAPIFDIKQAGTYYLVVMRRIESWDDGFMISNMVKINVVE